jgi:tetratricopeptide (TPR) repeat protein
MDYYQQAPGIVGGDKKKAALIAERIAKIDPARGLLARASFANRAKDKDWSLIEGLERKAFEADPQSYGAHLSLASLYLSGVFKKYDEAEKLARRALKLDPGRGGAYALLAQFYAWRERWQDLDAIVAEAEKNVPDDLNPEYQAAKVLLASSKDLPRAERCFRHYLTQEPEAETPHWSAAHWRLGQVMEKQGRKPEAVAELEAALKLEPEFELAQKDLKRLK